MGNRSVFCGGMRLRKSGWNRKRQNDYLAKWRMGMSEQVFCGAYLEIEAEKQTIVKETLVCSDHPEESGDEKNKFCPYCGKMFVPVKFEEKVKDALISLLDTEFEDELCEPEIEGDNLVLIGNKYDAKFPDCSLFDLDYFEVTEAMIKLFKINFAKNYEQVIKVLEARIGNRLKSMTIKFGVIIYFS